MRPSPKPEALCAICGRRLSWLRRRRGVPICWRRSKIYNFAHRERRRLLRALRNLRQQRAGLAQSLGLVWN